MRSSIALLAALLLTACGGGTDSDGGTPVAPGLPTTPITPMPAAPSTPAAPVTPVAPLSGTLTITSTTVDVQATTFDYAAQAKTVQLSLQDVDFTRPIYLGGSYTTHGIKSVKLVANGPDLGLFIAFKDPFAIAPGTYTDTVILKACGESACVNQLSGSPKTITVHYAVSAPAIPPQMSLQQSVSVQGFVLNTGGVTVPPVGITFSNPVSGNNPYVTVTSTSTGVASARYSRFAMDGAFQHLLDLYMKPPALLGEGTYTDVVTVKACIDINCAYQYPGSPASLSVNYTVGNTLTGPNGFTIRQVKTSAAAGANDLAWDQTRQLIYVSIGSNAPDNPDSIGVLDPATAAFTSFVSVGNNPGDLEISPDGQYLYVALRGAGVIKRLLLPALTPDLMIPLGATPGGATLHSWEFHVSPSEPRTIAVVRSASATSSGNEFDLAVFDDAVMRSQTIASASKVTTFQWDSPTRIFGVDSSSSLGTAFQIQVDASGLQTTRSSSGVTSFDHRGYLINDRMYMQTGRVFRPVGYAQWEPFQLGNSFPKVLTPDAALGKAFFLMQDGIKSFDLTSGNAIGSITLPGTMPDYFSSRQIRWGVDGLALLNSRSGSPGITLINGPFIKP